MCYGHFHEGFIPRFCIGYVTNGCNDFATVDYNDGVFLKEVLEF